MVSPVGVNRLMAGPLLFVKNFHFPFIGARFGPQRNSKAYTPFETRNARCFYSVDVREFLYRRSEIGDNRLKRDTFILTRFIWLS